MAIAAAGVNQVVARALYAVARRRRKAEAVVGPSFRPYTQIREEAQEK